MTGNKQADEFLDAEEQNPFEGAPSFPLKHRLLRLAWGVTWKLLAAWTPPQARKWRLLLLRAFGADVHATANVYPSVRIWYPPNLVMKARASMGPEVDCYTMGRVELGENVVVSQRAYLCTGTHDIRGAAFQILARPISIGDNAWVCAEAFVGPGVTVGEGAVLSARGAAFQDLDAWRVYQGNPARVVKERPRFARNWD